MFTQKVLSRPIIKGFFKSVIFFAFFLLLLTQSCHTPDSDAVNPYDYFPLNVGRYQIYQVREEVYSSGQKAPVIKIWQEKDEIIRIIEDSAANAVYVFSRSVRNTSSDYWQKSREYTVQAYPDKIILNIDNETLTPLIFPYDPSVKWNGYQYFNLKDTDDRYRTLHHYEEMDQTLYIDSLKFTKTLKVSERNDTTSQAKYNLGFKYYASGIGLVADEQTDFEYLQENGQFIGYRTIGSGIRRVKKIIAYGK